MIRRHFITKYCRLIEHYKFSCFCSSAKIYHLHTNGQSSYTHYRPITLYQNVTTTRQCSSCPKIAKNNTSSLISAHHFSTNANDSIMNVFDRQMKRRQRNQTAKLDHETYDYIKEEFGWRLADRIPDIKRHFGVAVELGCGRGHIGKHILSDTATILIQTDMAEDVLAQSIPSPEVPTVKLHIDEERLPFLPNSLDLVVSSLSLHWVNDLPGVFKQVNNALKPDACFIGCMFGGDTLFELRSSLLKAEMEFEKGVGVHVSPFTSVQDLGGLLNRTGYTMLTIDVDEIVVNYPTMMALMKDLQGMGESNATWTRKAHLHRNTMKQAEQIYTDMYGDQEKGCIPATFQVIYFIGWKADPSQPQAAERGSAQVSIQDIDKLDQLTKELSQTNNKSSKPAETVQHTADDIERLRQYTQQMKDKQHDDEPGGGKKT